MISMISSLSLKLYLKRHYDQKIISLFLSDFESVFAYVAEHSFQVPVPNSPLLLNHLCFGACFLQESRLITEVFFSHILARVCAVAMATGLVKNKAKK